MKYKLTEADVTRQIRDLLKLNGIWHFKHWSGMGSHPGVSDILGIYQRRFLAIEVKRSGRPLSALQQRFIDEVNANGGIGFKASSIEDVMRELKLKRVKLF